MSALSHTRDEAIGAVRCLQAGLIGFDRPDKVIAGLAAIRRFGALGGLPALAAARHADRVAVIDERGPLTFNDLERRSNAVADGWRTAGLRPGDGVGILVRNHRGFFDALFAAAKCGARIVLLNTDFAGPQLRDVVAAEGIAMLVHDDEYTVALTGIPLRLGRWRAWADADVPDGGPTLEDLVAAGTTWPPPPPSRAASLVILTSGTTGTPRGAVRDEPRGFGIAGGLLDRVPFRGRGVTECCAPMFHALGLAQALLALGLGSTVVIRRRFDARATLDSMVRHRVTALVVVPVMLQKILEIAPEPRQAPGVRDLRIIFVAGSQLGEALCRRVSDAFGPVVYNLYGSTEVAYATIATPDDLMAEPGCVGRPVRGVTVKILDGEGREVPTGTTGRVFVGSGVQFQGYTDGDTKEVVGGLMSSGDLGHFDHRRRLFIDGREDDLVVSGGEKMLPSEIEELLARHPDIVEAAALGVPDDTFGQRLAVYVVRRPGSAISEDGVRQHVRDNLARFKVPRDVVFLDELPRNPTGKVLKRALDPASPARGQ
ncbi:AMP-binding protein [Nocardioides stalactiti]|uniref:AMP-binding protein n=1 Tax=Nocardioides stalactiti TaxID=2755356 RepID=UPI0016032C0E|nr:AMP-binding protein [Nocardioides stalactiti]